VVQPCSLAGREQVIHFGASLEGDPTDRGCWDVWLGKFEALLRRLYWWSAVVHLETDFERECTFRWLPTERTVGLMLGDGPRPPSGRGPSRWTGRPPRGRLEKPGGAGGPARLQRKRR
jgi:hypothetical protein